jgi:sugar O-acyltransferase (sialic acid O-acetyltransferase NeuD family)
MTPIIIWGSSGHALVVADIARETATYEVAGFFEDFSPLGGRESHDGCRLFGPEHTLAGLYGTVAKHMAIGVGKNSTRRKLGESALAAGFELPALIHPRAIVAKSAVVGAGSVVMAGAIVNPHATIGRLCVINTGASVDHECVIEDAATVAPGARIAGRVKVQAGAWVGIGATIIQGVVIGAGSFIGAGAVVLKDVPPGAVVAGVPAKYMREVSGDV